MYTHINVTQVPDSRQQGWHQSRSLSLKKLGLPETSSPVGCTMYTWQNPKPICMVAFGLSAATFADDTPAP
ncbi:hypothetical protein PGT21_007040 [Puccinia graminis f. sp. tritici]|uniref:Uncharacterized protein n=1 Tax=Puccinia graminis f. sp. tritici TaxID=56615 RepID=A0A5B0QHL3_PUCGR|nr:hypothetical protein PGT21_007040 [Puccinia graminis f. sp. tritici]